MDKTGVINTKFAPASLVKTFMSTDYNTGVVQMVMIFRDENGQKRVGFIPRAQLDYYALKDKPVLTTLKPLTFMPIDRLEKKTVFADELYRSVAKDVDMGHYIQNCEINNLRSERANVLRHPYIFGCDGNLADYYISKFHKSHPVLMKSVIHKSYFDIEVDLQQGSPDPANTYQGFADEHIAPCPINAISFFDECSSTFEVFYLIQKNNASQVEWLNHKDEWTKEVMDEFNAEVFKGGLKATVKDVILHGHESELELIKDFIATRNKYDVDFLLAWNSRYDVQTIMNRLQLHLLKGGEYSRIAEMKYIMSDPKYLSFSTNGNNYEIKPAAYFKEDKLATVVERGDYYEDTSGCNTLDQMLLYAANRRMDGIKNSYALDAIAGLEIGAHKLEFDDGTSIANEAWKDWGKFLKYNMRDVLLLSVIEQKCKDVDIIQALSEVTSTRHNKVLKKTVSLRNFVENFVNEKGFILANNRSYDYGQAASFNEYMRSLIPLDPYLTDDSIGALYYKMFSNVSAAGGFVAKPSLNDNTGVDEFDTGDLSMYLFENVVDEDVAAMYPSIMIALNIEIDTMIGRFFWPNKTLRDKLYNEYGYDSHTLYDIKSKKNDLAGVDDGTDESDDGNEDELSKLEISNYDQRYDMADMLTDGVISRDWNKVGEKFFDLPNTTQLLAKLRKK